MRRLLVAGLAAIALAADLTDAFASDAWPGGPTATIFESDQFFLSVGGTGGVYHLPKFEAFSRTGFNFAADFGRLRIDPDVPALGGGGAIGYVFRTGTFPAWMGERVRVSVGGATWSGQATETVERSVPSGVEAVNVLSVSGTDNLGFGFQTFGDRVRLRTDYEAFELALRLASDMRLGPRLVVSPSVGVFGGQSTEDYFFLYGLIIVGGDRVGFIRETNRTWRVGGDVGLQATYWLLDNLGLSLGGRAGVVYLRTNMKGHDCFAQPSQPPFTVCTTPTFGFRTTVSDSASAVGFRGTVNLGLHLDSGWLQFSLVGFATYETDVPGIRNPSSGSARPTNQFGPARIRYSVGHSYGAMATIRVLLVGIW